MKKKPLERFCQNPLCEARLQAGKKINTCDQECSRTLIVLKKAAKMLGAFGERMAVKVIVDLIRQNI